MDILSNEKILLAIIGAISGILGGILVAVISPFIKERSETKRKLMDFKREDDQRRRDQIIKWRLMLLEVYQNSKYINDLGTGLQKHPDFLNLEPLLSPDAKRAIYHRNMTIVVGQTLQPPLDLVKEEIARIEKEWGLL